MISSAELDNLEAEADGYVGEARAALSGPDRRNADGFRLGWEVSAVYSLWAIERRLAQIAGLLGRADQ